jgi:hypothetical protein
MHTAKNIIVIVFSPICFIAVTPLSVILKTIR